MSRLLLALMLLVSACAPAPAAPQGEPESVTFMAGFKAQANLPFVAVYVAQERGYFAQQGLTVEIQHSAGQGEHVRLLGTGAVQFSTGSAADVIKRVAEAGVPLVSIALIGQEGEQAFAVRADSSIQSPKDWEGKLVGYKSTLSADYLALTKIFRVDRSLVREVAVGFDPRVLIQGQVDVYPVFTSNEPDTLARLGFPVRLFEPSRYGVPTLGLTLMTNRDMVEQRADTVRRFLKAALRGLEDAIADRDGAIDIVMRYAPAEDRAHQRAMLDVEIERAQNELTRARGLGATTAAQWEALYRFLLDNGALTKPVDLETVFTTRFVDELHRDGRLIWP